MRVGRIETNFFEMGLHSPMSWLTWQGLSDKEESQCWEVWGWKGWSPMPDLGVWYGGADSLLLSECKETETLTRTSKKREGSGKDRGAFRRGRWPQNHQKSSVIGIVWKWKRVEARKQKEYRRTQLSVCASDFSSQTKMMVSHLKKILLRGFSWPVSLNAIWWGEKKYWPMCLRLQGWAFPGDPCPRLSVSLHPR